MGAQLFGAALCALVTGSSAVAEAKSYKGAEVYSSKSFLYGRFEVRMRMIRGSGLLSTFFTYKEGSEISGNEWEELDIEALGKNDAKTWQSNLITGNPRKTSETYHNSPTSLADGFHTYTLEWTPEYASWSFDGVQVRKTQGGQVTALKAAATLRFNAWASSSTGWAGALDEAALPAYQFVNWIKYYRYDNGQFVLDWTDEFDTFDTSLWSLGDWTFDGNLVDFDTDNAVVKEGMLILAITKEGMTGFKGTVPTDDGTTTPLPDGGTNKPPESSGGGCQLGGAPSETRVGVLAVAGAATMLAIRRRRARRS